MRRKGLWRLLIAVTIAGLATWAWIEYHQGAVFTLILFSGPVAQFTGVQPLVWFFGYAVPFLMAVALVLWVIRGFTEDPN